MDLAFWASCRAVLRRREILLSRGYLHTLENLYFSYELKGLM